MGGDGRRRYLIEWNANDGRIDWKWNINDKKEERMK